MILNNLLLVAGTGRNSGKTTIVCRIIEQFRNQGITSIKISPHFHEPSAGLMRLSDGKGYEIFEETNRGSAKDSSRMLKSGAERVFYIQAVDRNVKEAFSEAYRLISSGKPVICESPSLINHVRPGLFIIMVSNSGGELKNIEIQSSFPHIEFTFEEVMKYGSLPLEFTDGKWVRVDSL